MLETLQLYTPTTKILQFTVQAARRRYAEARQFCERAWQQYYAAVDAGDPGKSVMGDLAKAYEDEATDAWQLMSDAEGWLLSMWN
jgi:hypothetical protein